MSRFNKNTKLTSINILSLSHKQSNIISTDVGSMAEEV